MAGIPFLIADVETLLGPRPSPGEYRVVPLSAGVPAHVYEDVHVVSYNDLDSVRAVIGPGIERQQNEILRRQEAAFWTSAME